MNTYSLSPAFCAHNKVIVMYQDDSKVTIGITDIQNNKLIMRIKHSFTLFDGKNRREIEFLQISIETYSRFIAKLFSYNTQDAINGVPVDIENKSESVSTQEQITESPVVNLTDSIILEAVAEHASDIHIEPVKENNKKDKTVFYYIVRYRIDGILTTTNSIQNGKYPFNMMCAVILRLKLLAGLNTTETRRPQDGRFTYKPGKDSTDIDIRVSFISEINGESVVLRILRRGILPPTLTSLGFTSEQERILLKLVNMQNKLILICGPTGAGKTTTLASLLSRISGSGRKIITIEDPVEYRLPGVTQIEANAGLKIGFDEILRRIFRHDPDVIMIGEIRDYKTAETAVRAALTGHLVLSTLHTSDSCSAILRLMDMGVKASFLSSVLGASIAQRLVKRTTGGRIAITEIFEVTSDISTYINDSCTSKSLFECMRINGMQTMQEDYEHKKREGLI